MGRTKIDEIVSSFDDVFSWVQDRGEVRSLYTTGQVSFSVSAKMTKLDERKFLSLPHGNRVYEGDWGFRRNVYGKDGQRIGQYCLPIEQAFAEYKQLKSQNSRTDK